MVTDRDMYIALATRDTRAANLKVGAVATKAVVTCVPEDDVHQALTFMKQALVHRLPVVGFGGRPRRLVPVDQDCASSAPSARLRRASASAATLASAWLSPTMPRAARGAMAATTLRS